jgi:hypothetical protein
MWGLTIYKSIFLENSVVGIICCDIQMCWSWSPEPQLNTVFKICYNFCYITSSVSAELCVYLYYCGLWCHYICVCLFCSVALILVSSKCTNENCLMFYDLKNPVGDVQKTEASSSRYVFKQPCLPWWLKGSSLPFFFVRVTNKSGRRQATFLLFDLIEKKVSCGMVMPSRYRMLCDLRLWPWNN